MSEREFWQIVYAAAITNNHSPNVARGIANEAVEHLQEEWSTWAFEDEEGGA